MTVNQTKYCVKKRGQPQTVTKKLWHATFAQKQVIYLNKNMSKLAMMILI